jgi:hypothetical protein
LTSHAGLVLIGQCFEAAQLNSLDARFPTSQGMRTSDIVKSYTGLLSLGKSGPSTSSGFEAMESFRQEPSSVWLRQCMERLVSAPAEQIGLREEMAV